MRIRAVALTFLAMAAAFVTALPDVHGATQTTFRFKSTQGSTAASSHSVRFTAQYVSGDSVLRNAYYVLDSGGNQLLGTVWDSGEWTWTANFDFSIRVFVNVNQGTYWYEELLIDGVRVAHGTVGNEGLTYTLSERTDLVVPQIDWLPASPEVGDNIHFTVHVNNEGTSNTSPWGQVGVRCFIDGSSIGDQYASNIAPGTTEFFDFYWTATAGNHTVHAVADYGDFIPESNEGNNERQESFSVSTPAGQEIKFIGRAVSRVERYNYGAWLVEVQEVIFGYPISGQVEVVTFMAAGHPSGWCTSGYVDPDIAPEDQVEVFAYQDRPGGWPIVCRSDNYYIKKVDTTPPTITNIRESADPINRQGCPSPNTVTIRADVSDASDLAWVRLYYQQTPGGSYSYIIVSLETGTTYKATIGPFSQTGTIQYFVAARDNAGNEKQSSYYTVTVNDCDTSGPSISNIRESADPIKRQGCPEPTTLTVRADVSDDRGLAWARLYYQQTPGGSYSYIIMSLETGTTYKATIGPFSQTGTIQYFVAARDNAGNEKQSSYYTVTVTDCPDTTPPTIGNIRESADPIKRQGCPEPTTLTVRADVSDASGLAWVRLYYQQTPGGSYTYKTMSHESGNTYAATIGPFSQTGTIQYFVAARDNAGNERQSSYYTVTVTDCPDTTLPTIGNIRESADPIKRQGCPEPTTLTVRADVSDDRGLAWARLYYQQTPGGSYSYIIMSLETGTTYKATIGPFFQTGTIQYFVAARDNAGNEKQSSYYTVTVNDCDTSGPSISNIRESADPINKLGCPSPNMVTIRADVSDPSGLAWVRLYYQQAAGGSYTYKTMSHESGNTYAATIGPVSWAGTVQYFVTAQDSGANEAQSSYRGLAVTDCDVIGSDFEPDQYGLRFRNFQDTCIGMSLTSLDYFSSRKPLPETHNHWIPGGAFEAGNQLQCYVIWRKLQSMGPSFGYEKLRDLQEPNRAVRNAQEYQKVLQSLRSRQPVVVMLRGAGPWSAHAVLAYEIRTIPTQNNHLLMVHDSNMTTSDGPGRNVIHLVGATEQGRPGLSFTYLGYNELYALSPSPLSPVDPDTSFPSSLCDLSTSAEADLRASGYDMQEAWGGTLDQGASSDGYAFTVYHAEPLALLVSWPGSSLKLSLWRPNGSLYTEEQANSPPLLVQLPAPESGEWTFRVTAIDVPHDGYPYVAAVGTRLSPQVYLPLILKDRASTHLPTPTPTSTPTEVPPALNTSRIDDATGDADPGYIDVVQAIIAFDELTDSLRVEMQLADDIPPNPSTYTAYLWSLDTDLDGSTGLRDNDIGVDYILRLAYDPDPSHVQNYGWYGYIDTYAAQPPQSQFTATVRARSVSFSVPIGYLDAPRTLYWLAATIGPSQGDKAPASTHVVLDLRDSTFFFDGFDGDADAWGNEYGGWQVGPEEHYSPTSSHRGESRSTAGNASWTDYTLEGDLKTTPTGAAALLLRAQDADNAVWFYFYPGGNSTYWHVMQDGVLQPGTSIRALNLPSETFEGPIHIAVEVAGSSYTAFVNGVEKNNLCDTTFAAGKIGVLVNQPLSSWWDNIRVVAP